MYSYETMNLLKINGVSTGGVSSSSRYIPNPSTYKVAPQDIDYNSERATDGTLHRNKIATKVTISVSWNNLNAKQMRSLCNAISDAQFTLHYYSPFTQSLESIEVYAGNKSCEAKQILGYDKAKWMLSFEMVEI